MNKSPLLGVALCIATSFSSATNPQDQASAPATAPAQQITRAGEQASVYGTAEHFTGRVRVDPLFTVNEHFNASLAYVTFEPGARSAWHTHPAGQRLVVTSGEGLTQEWGKPMQFIRTGDVFWCPPGVKHWHGATRSTAMTHLAMSGTANGKSVTWMEKVTNEQYYAH
jgi:quercetin dioxygenase-like cupin family protein